jgi:Uma2 family endonuclease
MTGRNLSDLSHLAKLISVEEYLNTSYRPDVEYVDGEIQERNLGEFDHADLQLALGTLLRNRQRDWTIRVVVEVRVQVAPTRFRIPDVCVLAAGLERERIIRHAPLLCLEVLSPRDRLNAMRKRVQDFLDMGVAEVWIFDPETRTAYVCKGDLSTPMTEHQSGTLRLAGTAIEIAVEAVFATLNE